MKKFFTFLTITIIVILTFWNAKKDTTIINQVYSGKNENWTAQFEVTGTETFKDKDGTLSYENDIKKVLKVNYKGDLSQLNSSRHIDISYKSSAGGGSNSGDIDGRLTSTSFTLKSSGQNCAFENKDEIIEVSINLDGKIQRIELSNTKK
ncbi:MAG: hypothetical protein K0R71_808 [Bacillales bacterium]|jgi:hypothetical protein|nr:hypothetical protein [Bacillales bacterium]